MGLKEVVFKVFRFDSEKDILPCYKTYTLKPKGNESLDTALEQIQEIDETLLFDKDSVIKVNKEVVLSSEAKVKDFGLEICIEPADSKRVKRDLITEYDDFFERFNSIKPTLCSEIKEITEKDEITNFNELAQAYFSCPSVDVNPEFIGPVGLSRAYDLYNQESDYFKKLKRLKVVNENNRGIWDCAGCNSCDRAVKSEVSPSVKIQKLKNETFEYDDVNNCSYGIKETKEVEKQIIANGHVSSFCTILKVKGFKVLEDAKEFCLLAKNKRFTNSKSIEKSQNLKEIKTLIKSARS